ncbi:hypothetical protein GCM10010315_55310 [Streptomyces luteosporeus]|uniref:Uncharacterized protein n=1 Tax=Streptomyces luteosporeus TaxID=173856 RepID=A0ABN3U6X2_9ACTN
MGLRLQGLADAVWGVLPPCRATAAAGREVRGDGAACDQAGWEFRLLGAPDAVLVRNVRWLAG